MRKVFIVTGVVVGLVFLGCALRVIYMILCISCTTPAIMEYEYSGSKQKFENGLQGLTSRNKNIIYKRTDTVGTTGTGYAYAITLSLKNNSDLIEYYFRYEETSKNNLEIKLIEAYNRTTKIGGYGITAVGMNELLKEFNSEILVKLRDEEHVELKVD